MIFLMWESHGCLPITIRDRDMTKASIIINSYKNNPDYLRQSIKSCLEQDGVDIRLIISTVKGDSAIEIAKSISNKIIIVKSAKPGIYEQLNKALAAVNGDWFAYFSGNDIALSTKIADEIKLCGDEKSVCYSVFHVTDANLKAKSMAMSMDYNYVQHLKRNYVSDVALVRRDVLARYGPFRLKYGNHAYWDFWLRIAEGEGEKAFVRNTKPEWLYRETLSSQHVVRKGKKSLQKKNKDLRIKMLRDHTK